MKSIWYSLLASIALFSCGDSNNEEFSEGYVQVNFQIDSLNGDFVILELLTTGPKRLQLDTIKSPENGKGSFSYNATKTSFYSVYVTGREGEIRFMANPGDQISISGNAANLFASAKIGGTNENDRLDSLITYIKATKYFTDSLNKVFKKAESKQMHFPLMEPFQKLYGNAKMKEEAFVLDFITKNPSQFSNLVAVNSLDRNRHRKIFQLVDSALVEAFPGNEDVIKYHSIIEKIYSSAIGKPAPNFTLLNTVDQRVTLSDFKGKYVLLDFWNTGCRPCIQEIPALKKIQADFGGDDFEIVSVCIDRNNPGTHEVWRKINEKYKINWTQVYDAGGLATAKNYKIAHYPTMMVVDPQGTIIDAGDHIRGENAYNIIKKLVGNE